VFAASCSAPVDAQSPADLVDREVSARVVTVLDGDTVDVVIAPTRRERVRLHGADTPEMQEPFNNAARNRTRVLLLQKDVTLLGRDVDPYGRLVARVVVDGRDASETLIGEGLACTLRRWSDDPALIAALSRARTSGLGFWAAGAEQPACVARELAALGAAVGGTAPRQSAPPVRSGAPGSQGSNGPFVGNVQSRVYHAPWCPNADCTNCTREFASHADAKAAGFRPAGDCLR